MRSQAESAMLVLLLACLAACHDETESDSDEPIAIEDATALDERPCPEDSQLTYENFGGPFVLSWCSGCHASALPDGERQGAPVGSDFDDAERVRGAAARIWLRSGDHNASMPPQAGPDDEDRTRLGEWLACGAR